jgi:hypothetical protein
MTDHKREVFDARANVSLLREELLGSATACNLRNSGKLLLI